LLESWLLTAVSHIKRYSETLLLIQLAAVNRPLPWFRVLIFAGTLSLAVSHAIRKAHPSQGKALYWLAGALFVIGMLGFLGVL